MTAVQSGKKFVPHREFKFANIWTKETPPPEGASDLQVTTFNLHFLRRVFNKTVDGITASTMLGGSLTKASVRLEVNKRLEEFYYKPTPCNRRFLYFGHYRLANEVLHPGTWHIRLCGLCGLGKTFKSLQEFKTHYERNHSINGHPSVFGEGRIADGFKRYRALGEGKPLTRRFKKPRKPAAMRGRRIPMDKCPRIVLKPTCVYWEKESNCSY